MYTDSINEIASRINEIKSTDVISSYPPAVLLFDNFINSDLPTLSGGVLTAYSTYFNDLSIPNGDGLNLLKGNSFCQLIGDDYIYPSIRQILWDNISIFSSGEYIKTKFNNTILNLSSYVQTLQGEYSDYIPDEPPIGATTPSKTKIEMFWEEKGISELESHFSPVKSMYSSVNSNINSVTSTIETWISYGLSVSFSVAMAQNIFAFKKINMKDETLFNVFNAEKDSVNIYSPPLCNFLNIVNGVLEKYSEADNIPDKIRKAVLEDMNVKKVSTDLYQILSSNFTYLLGD